MKTLYLLLLLLPLLLAGPVEAQKISKAEKAAQLEKAFQATQAIVESNRFVIEIDRVYPQSGRDVSRFNPRGKVTVKDSIAKGDLPFFGRAYSLPYGDGGGIKFDGPMKKKTMEIVEKRKRKFIRYQFSVSGGNDVYQFTIEIVAGGGCSIAISSNNRAQISYSGTLLPLEEEKEK